MGLQPKAGTSEINTSLRHQAHRRLESLMDDAEQNELYGTVGVEVNFERGRIISVRRRSDGTDK